MMINHIITSSLVIIFVLLIGNIFETKISASLKYALWLLVVIKLLVPLPGFESQFHILNFTKAYSEIISEQLDNMAEGNLSYEDSVTADKNMENQTNYTAIHNMEDDFYAVTGEEQELHTVAEEKNENIADRPGLLFVIIKFVYLAGVMLCFAVILISNIRFYRAFRSKRKYLQMFNEKIPVYEIEGYYGACLYGGFSPVIIVGDNTDMSIEQQHMILLHEYVHYVHGDHIWSMIRNLCVALYWYNPLVWIAASISRKDSEMACDEGTIRRLGKSKRATYGQTLLEVISKASKKKDITSAVFLNSTTATRGKKEMKKRIAVIAKKKKTSRIAIILTIALSVVCIGCTTGEPVDRTVSEEVNSTDENKGTVNEIEEIVRENLPDADSITQNYSNVYTESQKDKVCILIQPSEIREQLTYYYIPTDEVQEKLKTLLKNTEALSEEERGKTKGNLDFTCSWSLEYGDKQYQVFESGYMIGTDMKSFETVFYVQNPELIDTVNNLLVQELNYGMVDIGTIKDLVSATLSVKDFRTDYQLYEQTIHDDDKLKDLELWFSNAKRVSGVYDCGNNGAALLLKTSSGKEIKMSLAADDCTIFAMNGIYYDYRPADKITEGWYSNHVFDMFDQIPNAFKEENEEITSYVWPTVSTTISTVFGERVHPITGETRAIEYIGIAGNQGDSIYAVADGDIIDVGFDNTLGNYIVLATFMGEEVTYGHLDGSKVATGAQVKAGDIIGVMGKSGKATGTFLSLSVKVNGEIVDPALYLEMDAQNETITYNGKEYHKNELCNATLEWLELSEKDRMLSSYFPPEFMIFDETWGITLSAENITSKGITISCTQSGGKPTGELQTGSWYILETWTKEKGWVQMPYIIQDEIGWEQEAWLIPMDNTCKWEVNWEWLYGAIPSGKYRIGKSIMDFRGTKDYDTAIYYAEFEIKK